MGKSSKEKKKKESKKKSKSKNHSTSKSCFDDSLNDLKEAGFLLIDSELKTSTKTHPIPPPTSKQSSLKQSSSKSMVPISKSEHEKKESVVREVFDPLSGRTRLVKGSGEIIERIVSKSQHLSINKKATHGDGLSYIKNLFYAN